MPQDSLPDTARQSTRFLYLYALAVAGGSIAYIPLLTILLPVHVTKTAGESALNLLSYIAFAGAISASIANIGVGWVSDVSGTRRPWIAVGMLLSCALLLTIPMITQPAALIAVIVCWQFALNMMLAPL
ncbi:MAG: MFS transporter, partial [Sphingorhabdus sp.]|nr:MFS transporter [Sphingorhabdus sp.]